MVADLASFILRAGNWQGCVSGGEEWHSYAVLRGREPAGDTVGRRVIAMLFEHGKNPIQLFKIKDWPKVLEYATDKAEDAASSGSEIVLKSARSNF